MPTPSEITPDNSRASGFWALISHVCEAISAQNGVRGEGEGEGEGVRRRGSGR